jgi:anti-sigma-K factor RskA
MSSDSEHDDVEAYALGALSAEEAKVFERHLSGCSACTADVASYINVVNGLRSVQIPDPSAFPIRRLSSWQVRFARPLAIAAAAVLALGLSYAGGLSQQPANAAESEAVLRMVANASTDLHADRGERHVRVLVGAQEKETAIIVAGLSPVGPGHAYQVWVDGLSPGLLRRMRDGVEVLIVQGDIVRGAHRIGVSKEPAGGSERRTNAPLIGLDVQQS